MSTRIRMVIGSMTFVFIGTLLSATAVAQTDQVFAEERRAEVSTEEMPPAANEDQRPTGFHPNLTLSANFAWAHSDNVVGTLDGHNITLGYVVQGGWERISENRLHEWQTGLLWQLGLVQTPAIDELLKNTDIIDFSTAYLYHFPSVFWLGSFVGFRALTNMLPGYEVRTEETTVLRTDNNGNALPVEIYQSGDRIDLTDALAPTTLRETVGLFALPYDNKKARVDLRASIGAWETFVRDGYALDDDDTTPGLELKQLENSVQVGPQIDASMHGILRDGLGYALNAMVMWPFYTSIDNNLDKADLFNVEFEALLRVALVSWASLDYSFKAERTPLIIDDWQVQNSLLLTVSFDFFPPEPPAAAE